MVAYLYGHLRLICVLFAAVLFSGGCAHDVEIIAHRGASHLAPENTLASEALAWE